MISAHPYVNPRTEERTLFTWCRAIINWDDRSELITLLKCATFPHEEVSQCVITSVKTNNLDALKLLYEALPYAIAMDNILSRRALKFACLDGNCEIVKSILKAHWKRELFQRKQHQWEDLPKEEIPNKLKKIEERYSFTTPMLCYKKAIIPLHWALKSNNQELIDFLLEFSSDPNKVDKEGKTPLILAAERSLKSTRKIISWMRKHNCFSVEKLSKPIEISNKLSEIFLKRIVKADEMEAPWRIYAFISVENFIEKLQLIELTNLNKDVIILIFKKFLQSEQLDKYGFPSVLHSIYQVTS